MLFGMSLPANLNQLSADQLRVLLIEQEMRLADKDKELHWLQTRIDQIGRAHV